MPFTLTVGAGSAARRLTFDKSEVSLGSAPGSDVVLASSGEAGPAPRHAVVRWSRGRHVLVLLGRSGVLLNGAPVEVPLASGDRVQVGGVEVRFEEGADTRIVASPALPGRAAPRWAPGFAAAVVLLGVVAALVASLAGRPPPPPPRQRSPHVLGEQPSAEVYGLGDHLGVTVQAPNEARFQFEHHEGLPTVVYLAFEAHGIERTDQVEVSLNGVPLGAVTPTGELPRLQQVRLPRRYLEEDNEVAFDALDNPPRSDAWAVGRVHLVYRTPPACAPAECLREAKAAYDRALALLKVKDIAAGNLHDARQQLGQGLLFLENVEPRPELYGLLSGTRREVERELDERCSRILLTGKGGEESGQAGRAAQAYRDGLQWFPKTEVDGHPCRPRLVALLENLGARE